MGKSHVLIFIIYFRQSVLYEANKILKKLKLNDFMRKLDYESNRYISRTLLSNKGIPSPININEGILNNQNFWRCYSFLWIFTMTLPWIVFRQNYFTLTVITVYHLTFYEAFLMWYSWRHVCFLFSPRFANSTNIYPGNLLKIVDKENSISRDVTRVKWTLSIMLGVIFSDKCVQ